MANGKSFLLTALALFVAGEAFAQTDFETMPKNTVTLDIGPTITGSAIRLFGAILSESDPSISSSGFGTAAQYERQLLKQLSVGGRFSYLSGGLGIGNEVRDQGVTLKAALEMKISSFSLESHVRYYPFGETFFLDSMLGYANMTVKFSGAVIGDDAYGHKKKYPVSLDASRHYFTLGAKVGWRIDFGDQGGFVFEPSFGWYGGFSGSDTVGKQLVRSVDKDNGDLDEAVDTLDEFFGFVENFLFVGGSRFSLSFGWRF